MSTKIKWGILGCGNIARRFAYDLLKIKETDLAAVASTSKKRAADFAQLFRVKKAYSNYHDLVSDPEIDIVYIATTNNLHFENSLLCLNNNKPVLCEKPVTINARQLLQLMEAAEKNNLFFMEAMWMKFIPGILKLQELISSKMIGEVKKVTANFSIRTGFDPKHRLYNRELAGGALLDLGIYTLAFADLILGNKPEIVKSSVHIGTTGVDEYSTTILHYKDNCTATVSSSCSIIHAPNEALVCGTSGYIRVPDFFCPPKLELVTEAQTKTIATPYKPTGFYYQIKEVINCLNQGRRQSSILPLTSSLQILQTMDRLRNQWGLKFPGE